MLDLTAIKARAAARPPSPSPVRAAANLANPANRLMAGAPISQLATLASTGAKQVDPKLLVAAITRCCNARGDNDANGAALIAECSALDATGQADMLEHFHVEADRWERACRGGRP